MPQDDREKNKIPIADCITGRVYKIDCRNFSVGVYDGNEGFIGIRTKFGNSYLFTEYHYDQGPPFGTVESQIDTGIDVPDTIPIDENLETLDQKTGRPIYFDVPAADGGRGWVFKDTGEEGEDIRSVSVPNQPLFEFLDKIRRELWKEEE